MVMKVRITTYSLILCFVLASVILIYLDIRVPHQRPDNSFVNQFYVNQPKQEDILNKINLSELKQYSPKPVAFKLQSRQKIHVSTTTQWSVNTTSTEPPPLSTAHIIAVVSYMRSGSSLTADILQHFPHTVYVFEPFHTVTRRAIEGKPLIYLNGERVFIKPENLTDEFLTNELHKWFQCRFDELDIHSLLDNFHMQFSRSMRTLVQCWKMRPHTHKTMHQCLPSAIKMCQNAKQRLFKFIRLPMRIIQSVFNLYPNLQTIHLIRDPRGVLTSQIKLKKSSWEDISTTSRTHCDKVAEDLNVTVNLHFQDSQRARILIYETLAEDPIAVAKRIYNFIGMPVMKYVLDYVRKLTLDGRRKSCLYCIVRENSTKTANSWREEIEYQHMTTIDNNCPVVYGYIGYQRFNSPSELTDQHLPTFREPNTSIII